MSTVKMGRPTGNPKDTMLRMRVDKDTLMMLDKCAKPNDTTRSNAVRLSIRSMYNKIKNRVVNLWKVSLPYLIREQCSLWNIIS